MSAGSPFVLRVPIDVSRVPDFTPGRRISVLAWNRQGLQQRRLVSFERQVRMAVSFELDHAPESLQVALGPEAASATELRHLQTPFVAVPCSAWQSSQIIELPPIQVTPWDWWSWQHWRQSFRVTGRVVNGFGRPVAGAAVSAFDVDAWWWWTAHEQVGCAVTAGDGSFAMEFARSCGWRPWWWWATRDWQIDAALVAKITSFVRQYPGLSLLAAAANSVPSLEIFQPLLASGSRPLPSLLAGTVCQGGKAIDRVALEQIRQRLVEILPRRFPLPVWPWSEWAPWEDCGANLIFRVTQTQGDRTAVLLNEGIFNTRWDVSSSFDVKLIAQEAIWQRKRADWTLVDYLFPQRVSTPPDQKQGNRSAVPLCPPFDNARKNRPEC
jgi:hypothetical protein